MFHKIRKLINHIKWRFSKESCYDQMEKQGLAVFEMLSSMGNIYKKKCEVEE